MVFAAKSIKSLCPLEDFHIQVQANVEDIVERENWNENEAGFTTWFNEDLKC